jgi:hypothetical protein
MRLRTSVAVAIAGMATVIGLAAGPATAQMTGPNTSGGARATNDSVASGTCVAIDDSVCSGSGSAVDDSTSSGASHARDGSTSSGCATAVDESTASGSPCPPAGPATTVTTRPGGSTATTRPGTASPPRALALTGSSSTDLALLAFGALALGGLLVAAGRRHSEG